MSKVRSLFSLSTLPSLIPSTPTLSNTPAHPNSITDRTALLQTLSAHDTSTTHTYTLILLALPLLPVLLYIPLLFSLTTLPLSLVAVASLLASAYTLYFLPLPPTKFEEEHNTRNTPSWEKPTEKSVRRPVPYLSEATADTIAEYIVPANRAACGALALYETWQGRNWTEGFLVGGGYLPGLICFLILWARTELRIIDMDALEKMNKSAAGGKEKGR